MQLVYFVTSLPKLARGAAAPMTREAFALQARAHLDQRELVELERLLLLEEVERGVRIQTDAKLADPGVSGDALSELMCSREPAIAGGPRVADLPSWLHRSRPLRAQLRRFWREMHDQTGSDFLRRWSDFIVNYWEVITGLISKRQGMDRDAFMTQMLGSFDTTATAMIARYDDPEAGIGQRFPWVARIIAALDDEDLREGERALNDVQWDAITHFCNIDPFCVDAVLAYYLKLRIVEREAGWDDAAGERILESALRSAATGMDALWNVDGGGATSERT